VTERGRVTTHLKALLWMVFGVSFVFFILMQMNKDGGLNAPEKKTASADFDMKKMEKPKPKPKPKPEPKKKPEKPKRSAPTPTMMSSLGGIDTGLESFMSGDMDMGDSLLGDVGKDMVMTGDTVDVAPKPLQRSAMDYPKKARASGVEGYVLMNLFITQSGRVDQVKVLESYPEGVFDEVAVAGVKSWTFEPAMYQGKAVKVWAKQKVRFDLQ
jgi:protein TonB